MVAHVVRVGGSVALAAPPLVHVPRPVVRAPSTLSRAHACPVGHVRKTPYRNTTLGKPCRDTRRPLSQPKPSPAPNPVATLNFCLDIGLTNLCRERESLCRDPNHPACLETVSQHRDPCRDTEPESSIARASQQRAHACRARSHLIVRLA